MDHVALEIQTMSVLESALPNKIIRGFPQIVNQSFATLLEPLSDILEKLAEVVEM